MRKKILSILAIVTMMVSTCMVTLAAENPSATRTKLRSEGAIHFGQAGDVIIDTADFYTLADQMDLFKVRAVKQLGVMGTYLTRSGGDVAMTSANGVYAVHQKPSAGEVDPLSLSFATILEGMAVSQSIPLDPTAYGFPAGTSLYQKKDGTLSASSADDAEPISIHPAAAGNLSAGAAAWVNGKLMLGTGADMAEKLGETSEETSTPSTGSGLVKHSIASGYKLPEDVPVAYAYVVTTAAGSDGEDGNNAGSDPVFTVNSCTNRSLIFSQKYARSGFNVRVALYRVTGMPAGTTVKGSDGLLFY